MIESERRDQENPVYADCVKAEPVAPAVARSGRSAAIHPNAGQPGGVRDVFGATVLLLSFSMDSMVRFMVGFLGALAFLTASLKANPDTAATGLAQESTTMIAQGILDFSSNIIIGETRFDIIHQNIPLTDHPVIRPIKSTLNLTPVAPLNILRGNEIPSNLIWVQMDPYALRFRKQIVYSFPKLNHEGVWLFFIRPVSKLPKALSADSSEVSKKIFQYDRSASPHQLAKEFGVDTWFNKGNWFELAFDYSAFYLEGRTIRDLPLPDTLNPHFRAQLTELHEKVRSIRKNQKTKTKESEFSISAKQLKEIEMLIKLFQNPDSPPSIEQLPELKSEFSDAILREISGTPERAQTGR